MITPIDTNTAAAARDTAGISAASGTDALANKETFLRLLVAQLQNQNPLDPSDPLQYVTQLAQFSQLEQQLESRNELAAIRSGIEEWMKRSPATPASGG
jgi:flagellar basal-body rod modification protein FlgD